MIARPLTALCPLIAPPPPPFAAGMLKHLRQDELSAPTPGDTWVKVRALHACQPRVVAHAKERSINIVWSCHAAVGQAV